MVAPFASFSLVKQGGRQAIVHELEGQGRRQMEVVPGPITKVSGKGGPIRDNFVPGHVNLSNGPLEGSGFFSLGLLVKEKNT